MDPTLTVHVWLCRLTFPSTISVDSMLMAPENTILVASMRLQILSEPRRHCNRYVFSGIVGMMGVDKIVSEHSLFVV